MNYDPHKAPEHAVGILAAIAPQPRLPHGTGPTPEQWAAEVRAIADRIWSEAFFAGAGYGLGIQPPQPWRADLEELDGKMTVASDGRVKVGWFPTLERDQLTRDIDDLLGS